MKVVLDFDFNYFFKLILPPWPWFRRNPLEWQKPVKKDTEDKTKQSKPKEPKKKKTQ